MSRLRLIEYENDKKRIRFWNLIEMHCILGVLSSAGKLMFRAWESKSEIWHTYMYINRQRDKERSLSELRIMLRRIQKVKRRDKDSMKTAHVIVCAGKDENEAYRQSRDWDSMRRTTKPHWLVWSDSHQGTWPRTNVPRTSFKWLVGVWSSFDFEPSSCLAAWVVSV